MSLSETSIRRPVLAIVMSLIIVLFGLAGFYFLGVREYPAVDPPIVTVSTSYPGANPDVIASQITEPLEQMISGIAGIRTLSSESRHERSIITVEFTLDSDLDTAANDVRDRVARAARNLPADANPSVVEKADADSSPIINLSLSSDTRGVLEVSDIADRVVRERMETIPGVSSVRIFGEQRYAMRLWMDPVKLAVHGLTTSDVQAALNSQKHRSAERPAGRHRQRTLAAHPWPPHHPPGIQQPHYQTGKRPADPLRRHRLRAARSGKPAHRLQEQSDVPHRGSGGSPA